MLELHVASNDVTSGSIGVGWCVSPEALKMLADSEVKHPAIVLITAPKGQKDRSSPDYKEFRTVVPLKDLVAYVSFKTPGENNIWGFIASDVKSAKEKFLEKGARIGWEKEILSDDATQWPEWNLTGRLNANHSMYFQEPALKLLIAEPVPVTVPEACFAPEPAEWEKTWVNYFFTRRVMDQCEFRRRRILAYTVQPVLMVLQIAIRALALSFSTLLGLRAWSIKPLLHPVTTSFFEDGLGVLDFTKGSYFVGQGKNAFVNWLRLPFTPAILLALFFIVRCHALSHFGVVLLAVLGLVAFVMGGLALIGWNLDRLERIEAASTAWYLEESELPLIVCSTDNVKATNVNQLPAKKRTFRLRFQELKTKVCRPFSA